MNKKFIWIIVFLFCLVPVIADKKNNEINFVEDIIYEVNDTVLFYDNSNFFTLLNRKIRIDLYTGSAGYDKLYYPNGSVMVYEQKISVDDWRAADLSNKWNQIGIPFKTGWSESEGTYTVWRKYSNGQGVDYNITYILAPNKPLKITVAFADTGKSKRDFRVKWSLDGIVHSNYSTKTNKVKYEDIVVDFSDVKSSWGEITTLSHSTTAKGRKTEYYFTVGKQNNFILDPTITTEVDQVEDVYVIDLDQDGDVDIISASSVDDMLKWFENDGDGGFSNHTIGTGENFMSVFADDLDGDGDIDVISGANLGSYLEWWENDGSEAWTNHVIKSGVNSVEYIYVIDLDRDGDKDVLTVDFDDQVQWHENNGVEVFDAHNITTSLNNPEFIQAADIDLDGDYDVTVAASWHLQSTLAWYENDGSEGFTAHNLTTTGREGHFMAVPFDLDRDGDVDILATHKSLNVSVWYENDGSQSWTVHNISTIGEHTHPWYIDAADMDYDGDYDVLLASAQDDNVTWFENDGSQSWTAHLIPPDTNQPNGPVEAIPADIDGDGDLDVVVPSYIDDSIRWYRNEEMEVAINLMTVDATTDSSTNVVTWDAEWTGGNRLTKFMISNDSAFNLCNYTETSGCIANSSEVNASTTNGIASVTYTLTENLNWYARVYDQDGNYDENGTAIAALEHNITMVDQYIYGLDLDDIDLDGDLDIAYTFSYTDVYWSENNGSKDIWPNYTVDAGGCAVAYELTIEDLDLDGDKDIIAACAGTAIHYSDAEVNWYDNNGSQDFTRRQVGYEMRPFTVDVGDIDGDGDLDIAAGSWWSTYPPRVSWWESDGGSPPSFSNITVNEIFRPWTIMLADLDTDGDLDIINDNTGQGIVWNQHNGSGDPGWANFSISAETQMHGFGDVDGDGDLDVLIDDGSELQWLENTGVNVSWTTHTVTGSGNANSAIFHDMDMDGNLDVLSVDKSGGGEMAWYENNGSSPPGWERHNSSFGYAASVGYGGLVAGDIDNDGDQDYVTTVDWANVMWYETLQNERLVGNASFNEKPLVEYASPTLVNDSYIKVDSYYVNVSFTDDEPANATLNWNGTNESMTCGSGGCYVNKTSLLDATYHYMVAMNDTTGRENVTGIRYITVDTTFPQVAFSDPTLPNGSSINWNSYFVNVSYIDVNKNESLLQWITSNNTMTCDAVSCYRNHTNLVDGVHHYKVFMNDTAGNSNVTELRYLTVDTTLPVLDWSSPTMSNNTFISVNSYYVNISFNEPRRAATLLDWDGVNESMNCAGTHGGCNVNKTGLVDGSYYYKVFMNDTAGNANFTGRLWVTVDTAVPSLGWSSPTENNGSWVTVNSYEVNISYTETNRETTLLDWDGTNESMTCGTGGCSVNKTSITEGTYGYKVFMNDSAGNSNVLDIRYINVDLNIPWIDYATPTLANATYRNVNSYYINISFVEANRKNTYLDWNGANESMTCGSGGCYVNKTGLTTGNYYYKVFMDDEAAQTNVTGIRWIYIDVDAPTVTIIRPEATAYDTNTSLALNWTVVDDNQDTVWYHLLGEDNTTLTTNITFNCTDNQGHTLYLIANDTAGNVAQDTVEFSVASDTSNPSVTLNYPSNGTWLDYNNVFFNSTVTDAAPDTCKLYGDFGGTFIENQTDTDLTSGEEFNWTVVTLDDGTYHWNVWCNDSSNNVGTGASNFTVYTDGTFPLVDWSSPTMVNDTYINWNSYFVNVSYNETNIDNDLLDWNGVNQSMTCGTGGCYVNKTGVADGQYYYKVYIDDFAGNFNVTSRRWVTIDITSPSIDYSSPTKSNGSWVTVNSYEVNISYTETNKNITLLDWDGTNESMTCGSGGCTVNKTGLTEGTYYYKVFMNDTAGNSDTISIRYVNVDLNIPWIDYASPILVNDSYVSQESYYINISYVETNRKNTYLDWDGVNQSMTCGSGGCYVNKTGLLDGAYYYKVFMDDEAGQTNVTGIRWITIDTVNPVIDFTSPTYTNDTFTNVNSYYVNISYVDSNFNETLLDWNGTNESMTCGSGGCYVNKTSLADTRFYYNVFVNDTAGNSDTTEQRWITVDTTLPVLEDPSFIPATMYNNYSVVVNITLTETHPKRIWLETNATGSWVNYTMNNISTNYYFELSSGNFSNQVNITYRFHANDSAGNFNLTNWLYKHVENRVPELPTISTANATGSLSQSVILNFTTSDPDSDTGLNYFLWWDNGTYIANTTEEGYNWSDLGEGIHRFNVFAQDPYLGNSSRTDNTTIFIDLTLPNFSITSPVNATTYQTNAINFVYSANDNLNYTECSYSIRYVSSDGFHTSPANVSLTQCNTSEATVVLSMIDFDSYYLDFYVDDRGGNQNTTRVYYTTEAAAASSGGGGPSAPKAKIIIVNETVPAVAVCGNDICEIGEDLINCPEDCPLNVDTLSTTLRQAWFAKFAFFFVISSIIYLAYKDTGQKYTRHVMAIIPAGWRRKKKKRRRKK